MMPLSFRLPATSANLGPGFDALGLAMSLYLRVEATAAQEFTIHATGRDAGLVGSLKDNLMLQTYGALAPDAPALRLNIHNQIPLGMGCGSSAAAILAGVHLANQFGGLQLRPEQILAEACAREGHPDNVAACFYGGLTASAIVDGQVVAASLGHKLSWRLLLALPSASLATAEARALLPKTYLRAEVVANLQATALLVAAFALDRPHLLFAGTRDRIHQPARSGACPLLPLLLPLAGTAGIYSVSLSGAGPAVLLITDPAVDAETLKRKIKEAAAGRDVEILDTKIDGSGAQLDAQNE